MMEENTKLIVAMKVMTRVRVAAESGVLMHVSPFSALPGMISHQKRLS